MMSIRRNRSFVAILLLALGAPSWWRETNSHAASRRGSRAFAKQQYEAAATAYAQAQKIESSAQAAFNLGTAEIAAGRAQEGAGDLAAAIEEPSLRADALYNRGNAALAAKALDQAIADYKEALRAAPAHAAAKRNLEIALARRSAEQKQRSQSGAKGGRNEKQEQQSPSEGKNEQRGPMDLDALLRSVQQQEQEELRRMKGRAGEARVGW